MLALMLTASALITAAWAERRHPSTSATIPSSVRIESAAAADSSGLVIQAGLHVRNIYDLALADQSFLAEGWYWYQWGPDLQAVLERLRINPDDLIELSNEIELGQYSSREVAPSSPAALAPGTYGRIVRFSGKFYLQEVPQRYAPFDPQSLTIELEVEPDLLSLESNRVHLEPINRAASIVGESAQISGYRLDSVAWKRSLVRYPEDFLPGMKFSRLTAVLQYGKNEWSMFLKWIFPLLVVMIIVIVSPSIEGVLGDVRLAIPPSALLTLVVMQDSYKSSFPPAPYLTYLDELYVYSYVVCLLIFLLFLVGTNLVARCADQDRARVARRVNRIDTVVQLSALFGFVLVAVVGWCT